MAGIVKTNSLRRVVYAWLSVALLSAIAVADAPAPQFTARSLDGQTFSNSSLNGNVVLLQFWTTWCPVCHQDQAAVDRIQSEFGGSGLVVIAVDDGEPEALVRRYLQASPRSVPVVVSEGRALAAQFGVRSYPHYVVINRSGNVVVSRGGGGGEPYLRYLLASAGLGSQRPQTLQAGNRGAAAPSSGGGGGPKLTYVPAMPRAVLAKPIPKTIFIFANGEQLEADHYVVYPKFLHVTADGQDRSIPISSLDIPKTVALNRQRGINLKIPTSGNEVFLAF